VPRLLASAPRPDDAARQARLKTMKRRATGLLVLAGAVFIGARLFESTYPWLGFIRATAEASLVGGLADWFAVTALFRKPLGLPIPHTAIVATQKDRIGRTLGNFVQGHFLSREVLASELRAMKLSHRVGRWLSDPQNSNRIAQQVVTGLAKTIEALPEGEVRELIHKSAVSRLQATHVAPILGDALALVTQDNRHQDLLNEVVGLLAQAVRDNREAIRRKIHDESPWWIPGLVDDAIYRRIILAIEELLNQVRADPNHEVRHRFDAALKKFIDQLKHSPEVDARAEALKEQLLSQPLVEELAASLWDAARRGAARYRTEPAPDAPEALGRGISAAGESLLANPSLLRDLDHFLIDLVASSAERHRQEVAELIAHAISAWDPEVAVRRLELSVGSDLQYIRMNGTLVGGLVGLLIYTALVILR
jgi:uncharacterized membrane-anchored protein YjiN (DUF445 family)